MDQYVSSRSKNNLYGKRFAAVGRLSSEAIEAGFMDAIQLGFWNMMFEVEGVSINK